MKNVNKFLFLHVLFLITLESCAPYFSQPLKPSGARLGAETDAGEKIEKLPQPQEKIVAAVYKFRDQTGQYKPVENGSSFSTAVTQGGTSILLRALEESGWFTAIERENLGNLLNERKIIRSSRAEFGDNTALPPLLFAGIVLEGGIISYDANILTGGMGLRYFGAGASGQYREDRVTIYLRAISTSNGRILKTVYTSKNILSQAIDVGLFRYVKFKRLLEAETGFTYNEPAEMAVKDAIEKAVESLIIEGIIEGLWNPSDSTDSAGIIASYQEEKDENQNINVFNRELIKRRKKLSVGMLGGGFLYDGDYANAKIQPGVELFFNYSLNQAFFIGLNIENGMLSTENVFKENFTAGSLRINYRFFPKAIYTPMAFIGTGLLSSNQNTLNFSPPLYGFIVTGMGVEFLPTDRFGIKMILDHHYLFKDNLDDQVQGNYNDFFWGGKIGFSYYFGASF